MSRWPGINEWLFAVKTFAAAMLALYIAVSIGLDRPYWAMATVYVIAQPLTGALRSKAAIQGALPPDRYLGRSRRDRGAGAEPG
jgi:uncharacterized membrane protein YccC